MQVTFLNIACFRTGQTGLQRRQMMELNTECLNVMVAGYGYGNDYLREI
jgi:hypothetical protein